ncbi:MAG: bifunctional adenosylcobinamide kinase/adenosylcobinamide-phosphate guanylyltransferase [Rhodobacteraceae bacterium]|nr:bifunctional adenosylcobinamide kinase/adenosylcobinamide-phosphate guanylyltransferase [Paracoccaceae bacterium]MAY46399.1 bifunctional adenosylcobinamide kinase/adenosylcobinamide-phosphate guanylyltransferase [Paracoccaceae bacterium]
MAEPFTFALGGAASGKSAYAEALVTGQPGPWIYIATGQAFDDEMRAKIDLHKARRGAGWQTIEAPLDVVSPLSGLTRGAVLIDCATFWLTNHLFAETDLGAATEALLDAIDACPLAVTIVSNEVGQGVVPENALARRFREAQGRLNIALAARADVVVHVVAGLANVLKGQP